MGELKEAVEAAIAIGKMSKFSDLLSRQAAPVEQGEGGEEEEGEEEGEGEGEEEEDDDTPWTGAAPPLQQGLAAGSCICLRGIASEPQLNGRDGWSLGLHPETGRCTVRLEPLPGERMAAPFTVKPECVDGSKEPDPDPSSVEQYISDEQIAKALASGNCAGERTAERTKLAIHAALTVRERFYYGPRGMDGLEHAVAKRMRYLESTFHSAAKIKWWVDNMAAAGSPDFFCEHTGEEVHFYCLNARQIAAFVRTGFAPHDGILPPPFHRLFPLDGEY